MATSKFQFGYTSGQTLTAKLFAVGGDSVLFTTTSLAESPASSGLYLATFTEASALNGAYRAIVFSGTTGVASYEVEFSGVDSETVQASEFVNVDIPSGGDATAANQTAILAKLNTNPIEITNPLVDSSTLVLINHDDYSSNNSRLITFPVTTDYSTATNVKLIFETNGANIKVASAVVASATSITVDLTVDFGLSLSFANCSGAVCDQVATCDFALVATYGTDQESISRGTSYIYDRAKES